MPQKNKPYILLTGDDSFKAEGLILVKRVVEQFADVQIVATKTQQSVAGSKMTIPPVHWGVEEVDRHEAIWVDGTPSDAVYFAFAHLERKPDLVISGINMGLNIGDQIHRSGTIAAAVTAVQSRQTPAIAFSLDSHSDNWFKEHDGSFTEGLLEYPGKHVERFVKAALDFQFPKDVFWNINFPAEPTKKVTVVPTGPGDYWPNLMDVNTDQHMAQYKRVYPITTPAGTDTHEVRNGFVTVTPCKVSYTEQSLLTELEKVFS